MRWAAFAAEQPRLAELGCRRLTDPGVLLVGTVRADGSPRISPVEPLIWRGDLWLSMMWGSQKARDLLRDPRILVHSVVTNRDGADGEFKVRGRAVAETEPPVQAQYAEEAHRRLGWTPPPVVGRFHLFRVEVGEVTFIRYATATGDQLVTRWPHGGEFVRRLTSTTSVGSPEPLAGGGLLTRSGG